MGLRPLNLIGLNNLTVTGETMSNPISKAGGPSCPPDRSPPKPRGLAVAKIGGAQCAAGGGSVSDCPYRSKLWQSVWLGAFSRTAQQHFDFKTKKGRGGRKS